MDHYTITKRGQDLGWCVRYEHAQGPIELKCFKHLSSAVKYGQWIANTSTSGRLTVKHHDEETGEIVFWHR